MLSARAFYEANHSTTLRKALLSKPRAEHLTLQIGDYAYYWRTTDKKLAISRWRGPALVCAIEPRTLDSGAARPSVYWLAHGSALVHVTPRAYSS